ncbi:MAG: hypothetical protein ACLP19_23500 [Xanthobacteraceae bacterium]
MATGMGNNDQNILDVVIDVTRDLRRNAEFVALLRTLDDESARQLAKAYIEFFVSFDGPGAAAQRR